MNISIKIIIAAVAFIAGVTGLTVGIIGTKFAEPATTVLSPFLLISIAILIFSIGYAASILIGRKK